MNSEVLIPSVQQQQQQQYAQQLALVVENGSSNRSLSRSSEESISSEVPSPASNTTGSQVTGTQQSTPQNASQLLNGMTVAANPQVQQQTIPQNLGMALQATGLDQNFSFNSHDIFNFQNSSLLPYPVLSQFQGRFNGFDAKPDLQQIHAQMQMREAKPYKCTQCIKAFANSSYLSQHMRIHLGIKPFGPCQYCGKKFTQLSHLQQHIRTHTGEKPYKCKYQGCEKAFSQLSNLQSHSRCHQTDKPFKCNSCYKCFSDEQSLLEHIPKHKESKHLKVHICPFCGKSYTQATYLQKHMSKHADRARNVRFPIGLGQDFAAEAAALDLNSATWNTQLPSMPEDPTSTQNHQLSFNQFNASMMNAAVSQSAQTTYPQPSLNNGFAAFELQHLLNFQRTRGYLDQYSNNFAKPQTERTAGFNMITPLENIQRYTQQGAAAAAATTTTAAAAATAVHPPFLASAMKPAAY